MYVTWQCNGNRDHIGADLAAVSSNALTLEAVRIEETRRACAAVCTRLTFTRIYNCITNNLQSARIRFRTDCVCFIHKAFYTAGGPQFWRMSMHTGRHWYHSFGLRRFQFSIVIKALSQTVLGKNTYVTDGRTELV